MKPPKKVYLVWEEDSDGDGNFYIYHSITDAVLCSEDKDSSVMVHEAEVKVLGYYKTTTKVVKVKSK